jgi:hypothetical protein
MSEPAGFDRTFFARAKAALDKSYVDRIVVEDNFIEVKFDVSDPKIEEIPFNHLTTSYDMVRICRVEQYKSAVYSGVEEMYLMITISDMKSVEDDDGEKIEHKIAMHYWILSLQRGYHAPVVLSHRQITFDMARGGHIGMPSPDRYVPITSYLRCRHTATTEEVLQMIEELLNTKETPLDFSTVQ